MKSKLGLLWIWLASAIFIAGSVACSDQPERASNPVGYIPNLANPAAVKCLEDGYQLEPVLKNGAPIGYLCTDPKTGKTCEVWQYFRRECRLGQRQN